MSEKKKNLSDYQADDINDASHLSFSIIVAEWNSEITFALRDGAINTLKRHGVPEENIRVTYVPGSFELPMAAKYAASYTMPDAIICIGCVIQGETRHFDFINIAVANGITNVGLDSDIPVIYGVLTPDNWEQAKDRAGGKHGNKGDEAAITALKMAFLKEEYILDDELSHEWYDEDDDDEFDDDEFDEDYGDDGPFRDDDDKEDLSKLN